MPLFRRKRKPRRAITDVDWWDSGPDSEGTVRPRPSADLARPVDNRLGWRVKRRLWKERHQERRREEEAWRREERVRSAAVAEETARLRRDRSRWAHPALLFLVAALVLGALTTVWAVRNHPLDTRAVPAYGRVVEGNGSIVDVLYDWDGQRVLSSAVAGTGTGRDVSPGEWVPIEVAPGDPPIVALRGERHPAGAAALATAVCFGLAVALFRLHARVSQNHPGLPRGEGLMARSRGLFTSHHPVLLLGYGGFVLLLVFLLAAPSEYMVEPHRTTAEVVDYRSCASRSCTGYDGTLVYRVDDTEYEIPGHNIPPDIGARVDIRYSALDPSRAVVVEEYERERGLGGPWYPVALMGACCVCAAFHRPVDYHLRARKEHRARRS